MTNQDIVFYADAIIFVYLLILCWPLAVAWLAWHMRKHLKT